MKVKIMLTILLLSTFMVTSFLSSQELNGVSSMDKDFLDSLPESVRADVLDEMGSKGGDEQNFRRKPSSEISKLETNKRTFKTTISKVSKTHKIC